jgi:hypothetical protein
MFALKCVHFFAAGGQSFSGIIFDLQNLPQSRMADACEILNLLSFVCSADFHGLQSIRVYG